MSNTNLPKITMSRTLFAGSLVIAVLALTVPVAVMGVPVVVSLSGSAMFGFLGAMVSYFDIE